MIWRPLGKREGWEQTQCKTWTDNEKRHGWDQTRSRFTLQRTESRVRTNPTECAKKMPRDTSRSKPSVVLHCNAGNRWVRTHPTESAEKTQRDAGGSKPRVAKHRTQRKPNGSKLDRHRTENAIRDGWEQTQCTTLHETYDWYFALFSETH